MQKLSFTLSIEDASELLENWGSYFKIGDRELALSVYDDSYLYYADGAKLLVDVIVMDSNTNTYYKIKGGVICIRSENSYVWCEFPELDSNLKVQFDLVTKIYDGEHWVLEED